MTTRNENPPQHDDHDRAALSRRSFLRRGAAIGAAGVAAGSLSSLLTAPASAATIQTPFGTAPGVFRNQGAPRRGGSLSWAYTTIPLKLDPIWTQARTDNIANNQIVECLVRPNRMAELEPGLASKWSISDDGLTYTFNLRQGVKFHNGKTLSADDVIASLNRARTNGTYKWSLENVDAMSKVDDSTVQISLKTKVASFIARMAMINNAIFPKEEIDKIGADEFSQPVGTGPFKFGEWVRGDHLTLKKFDDYWDMGADGKPLPYIDELAIKQVAESSTQVLQVQAGTLSGTEGIPFSQLSALENDSRTQLMVLPQQQIYFMVVRCDKPPFDDVNIRRAMSLALDRQVFVNLATAGKAEVANSFMPKSGAYWNPELSLPYDPDKAKQLVAQSKYPNGISGAKLQLTSGGQLGRDNAVLAKEMWDAVGIGVTIEEVEGSTLSQNWYKGEFDTISGYQWTNGMADPEQLAIFFLVEPRMNTGYQPSQSTIDLCKAASAELDPDKRRQMYYELQRIYNEDVGGTITLYYTPSVNYLAGNVRGFFRTPLGLPLFKECWLAS